ncbi:thioredoxin fold domain-containing protein [Pedobacter gandavensis]|uniref:TlpA family protein disulfide reductase n=1 Tax=Pedobacter TaxID=84567 RepID=UPI0021065A99|nr:MULTISPECIES: thioredoxin fold domain-containing protein [Pedobacter]WGQ09129.1 thioredoxin fold domain-containing protein [Pedobacter gandavensis]
MDLQIQPNIILYFNMKKALVFFWLIFLFTLIGYLFWYNDIIYQLPTPIPKNYKSMETGSLIVNQALNNNHGKPIFLHFFNPDCPCSRFNMKHFKSLVKEYGNRIDFRVVVLSPKSFTQETIQDKFGLQIPVLFDKSLAETCGVYSTPQAVLLDPAQHLYYRGNYNTTRYCTDEKTSFAKIALNGLLKKQTGLVFSQAALKSYGCTLPDCK